jgi:hypothetical protein
MQYVVSAENNSYFYWQLELLIESFKINGIDNQLTVFLAENDLPKISGFSKNLINHKNKFEHENFGLKNNCLSLNRPFAILQALRSGYLKFPFALIHADMVLKTPLKEEFEEDIILDSYFLKPSNYKISEEINEILNKRGLQDRTKAPDMLPPFGVIVFNNALNELFFHSVINKTIKFNETKGKNFPSEYAAWEISFFEILGGYSFEGKNFSCGLLDESESNFVHYKYGIPPYFNKKYFVDNNKILSGRISPYDVILEHNLTSNSNYLNRIINSYRKTI